jgi:hypothetical protein
MTDGLTVLENHSTGTVTIESAGFYGAQHLVFVRAVVVPIRYDSIGFSPGWPPARYNTSLPGVRWNRRADVTGAKVPPRPTLNGYRNLVIAMRPTGHKGTAAGVQVRYRENGQQYILRTHTKTVVVVARTAFKC